MRGVVRIQGRWRPIGLVLTIAALCLAGPVTGQDQSVDQAQEELAEIRREAETLARDFVSDRPQGDTASIDIDAILREAERFSADAREMQENLTLRLGELGADAAQEAFFDDEGRIDAGALAAAAGDVARASRETGDKAPLFVTLVSLSMPDAALTSIIRDTKEAGGVVVVRGFYGGGYSGFAGRVRDLFEEGDDVGISVDPRYFQALGVTRVPTYGLVLGEPVCEGFACAPVPADTISGNISVAAALELLADQGEVAPAHARAALARIGGAP